ncbi:hypothetical protein ACFWTE_26195 [Nocardiopsis sp. NPDC058631]|uniref:hypothetical protein n=1 Tax=Nocardiopsis sp. NPDC058631 TaxID=3346566 RepID=UPI0036464842
MSDKRCERTSAQTLAALGAAVLLLPLAAPVPALAESGWTRQDLDSADRVGLVLESGVLRPDGPEADGGGASLRLEEGRAGTGLATFPEQPLHHTTDSVDVRVRADGDIEDLLTEVRGVRPDGMWTEWHQAPGSGGRVTLPHDVSRVQLRVEVDGDSTALTGLRLRPLVSSADQPDGGRGEEGGAEGAGAAAPFSARLFATRIGLVGGTTANGHTVREDDHFAALPSRRGLAARGGGEYTVRVCTTGALGPEGEGGTADHEPRCSYLPVWDVGPWNTSDDHWNDDRESWRGLDRGRPQAQAAYQEGHNGGLDEFGREVRNPAGIDLADGAFQEGLQLPTNGWVDVDYLWTAEYRQRAEITTATQSDPVVVRGGPGREHGPVGLAAHSATVDVACQAAGDEETGPFGTSRAWYRIGPGNYVPAVFADGGADAPVCTDL